MNKVGCRVMFHRSKVASFQEQDCKLTLRKALEEFYNINSSFFNKPNPNNDWNELLVHHDVGHVFFGVNTTLIDEAAGDCWTLFATDMKFSEYLKYTKTPEAQRILKSIGIKKLFKSIIYTIPLLIKVFILMLEYSLFKFSKVFPFISVAITFAPSL